MTTRQSRAKTSGTGQGSPFVLSVVLIAAWSGVVLYGLLAGSGDPEWRLISYGALACLFVTLPAAVRGFTFASAWSMVIFVTYLGCGLRVFAVVNRGLSDPDVDRLYLLGRGLEVVDKWVWVYLLGIFLLSASYIAGGLRGELEQARTGKRYFEFAPRSLFVIIALAAVGFYGFIWYANATGGLNLEQFSAKRTRYVPGQEYEGSHGLQRTLNNLASVAFWMAVARNASMAKVGRKGAFRWMFLAILFANAILLSVYSSTRAQVAFVLIIGVVIHYLVAGKINKAFLVVAAFAGAAFMGLLTILRNQAQGRDETVSLRDSLASLNEGIVLNLNFTEIFKSVNIMEAVPSVIPHSNGSSLMNYIYAPVPRFLWSDKPIMDAGVEIGVKIYGTDGTSIPPGFIGESFWAFGVAGVVVCSILAGYLLRLANDKLLMNGRGDPGYSVIYGGALFPVPATAIGGSLGNALFTGLLWYVLVVVGLRLAGRWGKADGIARI